MKTIDHSDAPTAIRVDLAAIFVSLELSRSKWLITSLSPGAGERMSKFTVTGGDATGLLACLIELQRKAKARTGRSFRIVSIQEAGDRRPQHVGADGLLLPPLPSGLRP